MVRLNCGDDKELGTTLPLDVLEKKGLVNQAASELDPRLKERQRIALHEYYEREFEKIYVLLRGVSHWMDTAGLVRENPCYKRTKRDVDRWKKVAYNTKEFKDVYFGILRMLAELQKRSMLRTNDQKRLQRIAASTNQRKVITRSKSHLSDDQQERCDGMGIRIRETVETHDLLGSQGEEGIT